MFHCSPSNPFSTALERFPQLVPFHSLQVSVRDRLCRLELLIGEKGSELILTILSMKGCK